MYIYILTQKYVYELFNFVFFILTLGFSTCVLPTPHLDVTHYLAMALHSAVLGGEPSTP